MQVSFSAVEDTSRSDTEATEVSLFQDAQFCKSWASLRRETSRNIRNFIGQTPLRNLRPGEPETLPPAWISAYCSEMYTILPFFFVLRSPR